MRLHKRIIVSAIALALASQFSALSAKSAVDQQLINEAMPMVDRAPEGFFVSAPYINTLITMNVRVYDSQGEELLNVRSQGETVELLAADLPDGEYNYQTVTVFQLDEAVGEGNEITDKALSREFGTFTIKDHSVVQPEIQLDEESREQDEVSLMDTVLDTAITTLAYALSPFVSSASAQNLFADSLAPSVNYDDTTSTSSTEFQSVVSAVADDSSGSWVLNDLVGFASPVTPVISISTVENSAIINSMVISSNGDMRFANSGMFYDKSAQQLAIGTGSTPAMISLSGLFPDINLLDETDGSQAEWQLDDEKQSQFWGWTPANGWRNIMNYKIDAPSNSLSIDSSGNTETGGNLNAIGGLSTTSGSLSVTTTGAIAGLTWVNDTTNIVSQLSGTNLEYGVLFGPNGILYSYSTQAPGSSLVVDANGNVGFGTAMPAEAVDVSRSAAASRFQLTSYTNAGNQAAQFVQRRAKGTSSAPAAVQNFDNLGVYSFRGYNGSGFTGTKASISAKATENWTSNSNGTRLTFATTQNGTTDLTVVMEITDDGKVKINGSTLNVPDYVFEEDYQLMSLDELAAFIEVNNHLPGVASAEEVNSGGLDLAGSQLSVLEKVEELTLYTLQQHEALKQLEALIQENEQLKASQSELLAAFVDLEQKLEKVDQLEQMVDLLIQRENDDRLLTSLKD